MLWDAPLIAKLLALYKENRVLWDQKHHNYCDKDVRHLALQGIREELKIPVSPNDIHRKYKTMRAAYQVEVRNINAAKLRGFFYKPTLHWFDIFHKFMEDTKEIKAQDTAKADFVLGKLMKEQQDISRKLAEQSVLLVEEPTRQSENRKNFTIINNNERALPVGRPVKRQSPQVVIYDENESDAEMSSDESEDEFQTFADHIAEQLRTMSVHRAVMIQNQIQRIFARDREMNDEE